MGIEPTTSAWEADKNRAETLINSRFLDFFDLYLTVIKQRIHSGHIS